MWTCPKCKREFKKINQMHSCKSYPIEQHFLDKNYAKALFEKLVETIKEQIGPIKIESLPCCIHFVSTYTFGAAWALKDGIRIDMRLDHKVENVNAYKEIKISTNRYMYYFNIKHEKDINDELINLLKEAYFFHGTQDLLPKKSCK